MAAPRIPYALSPAPENSRTYLGSVITVAVGGDRTRGRAAVVEYHARPGNEPPPHVHEWEDEFYHILEGRAEFYSGADRLVAGPGDYAFVPQGAPHTFRILTPALRMVITVASVDGRPVGLDRYFIETGEPARSMELPADATTYSTADPEAMTAAGRLAAAYGTRILSPDEVARLVPSFPAPGAAGREVAELEVIP